MTERNGSTTLDTGTAEIPVIRPDAEPTPVPGPPGSSVEPNGTAEPNVAVEQDLVPGMHPTAPVTVWFAGAFWTPTERSVRAMMPAR